MTKKEATEAFQQGAPIMVVEFRSGKAEEFSKRDEETGRLKSTKIITSQVEAGALSIAVKEFIRDDSYDVAKYVQPFKKGTSCLLHLRSLTSDKGNTTAFGTLEALTD